MSNFQNVNNEIEDLSIKYLSMKYTIEPDINSVWSHRDITYNDAGTPIVKLYVGETKRLFKNIYVNDSLNDNITFDMKLEVESYQCIVDDKLICEISGKSNDNWIDIYAVSPGLYSISTEVTGKINENEQISIGDNNVLILVEDKPKVVELFWKHNNPLIIKKVNDDDTYVSIKLQALHTNGDIIDLPDNQIRKINFLGCGYHTIHVSMSKTGKSFFVPAWNTVSYITIDTNFEHDLFNSDVKVPDALKIIAYDDIPFELLDSAKIYCDYPEIIPNMTMNFTREVHIKEIYELSNGSKLQHEACFGTPNYKWNCSNIDIIGVGDGTGLLTSYEILDTATIEITYTDSSLNEYAVIPKYLKWDIRVIKSLVSIDWSIDKTELGIGKDEGVITAIAAYDDGTTEDVSLICAFDYDSNVININENKIIPVNPGKTSIKLLSYNNIDVDNQIVHDVTSIVRLENIFILDENGNKLNNIDTNLFVGIEKKLKYEIYPENATISGIEWMSSDSSIVKVSETGVISVLKKGYVTIFAKVKVDENSIESSNNLIYGNCNINAFNVPVESISFGNESITIYVGDEKTNYSVNISPEHVTNKNVKISLTNCEDKSFLIIGKSDYYLQAKKAGMGVLRIESVDNPEIYDEMKVIAIDDRLDKITIHGISDPNYEEIDNDVLSPEMFYDDGHRIDEKEQYDDDDFTRLLCTLNHSMQLSATISPSGASANSLTWYTSDSNLLKITSDGIITARVKGNREFSDFKFNRFPYTVWVSAYDSKSGKSGLCQVRVMNNYITAINIPNVTTTHDYDKDLLDENGQMPELSDYAFDYIVNYGDTIELPVTLETGNEFTPSNNIRWRGYVIPDEFGAITVNDMLEFTDEKISHKNTAETFDWSENSINEINYNKKHLNVKIKAIALGSIQIQAISDRSVSSEDDIIKSRFVKIRVVASPNDIKIIFRDNTDIINSGLSYYAGYVVLTQPKVKLDYGFNKRIPMFILFDEDFEKILSDSVDVWGEVRLDEKWMSFAWFSSNPEVITFEEYVNYESDIRYSSEDKQQFDDGMYKEYGLMRNDLRVNGKTVIFHNDYGYGRYMNLCIKGTGEANITVVNIATGKSWQRTIEVVDTSEED